MKSTLTNLIGTGLIGLGSLFSGCRTANYDAGKFNVLYNRDVREITKIADKPVGYFEQTQPKSFGSNLDHKKTLETVGIYENLPPQKVNLYFRIGSAGENVSDTQVLDTSGPLNAYADKIQNLERITSMISPIAKKVELNLGNPDRNLMFSRSGDNQLTDETGLLRVESYSDMTKNNFLIEVTEITKLNKRLNETKKYKVDIRFGEEFFKAKKVRRDRMFFIDGAEESALGFAIAGPWGAGLTAARWGIEGVVSKVEGRNPSKDTFKTGNEDFISAMPIASSRAYSILENSHKDHATDIILVDLTDCKNPEANGLGVIYAKNAEKVQIMNRCASFTTTEVGINHLKAAFARFLMKAPIIIEKEVTAHGTSFGGGRRDGSGGAGNSEFGGGRSDDSSGGSDGGRGGSSGGY